MGASGWMYITKYNSNIQFALDLLREEIFQKGNYYVRTAFTNDAVSLADILPQNASEEDIEALTEQYQSRQQEEQPEAFHSINELLAWNGEEGTHSILDVHTVIATPLQHPTITAMESGLQRRLSTEEFIEIIRERTGKVYPLSEEQLLSLFGTTIPEHQEVMRNVDQLYKFRDRGVGTYIIMYQENKPEEILFIGFSGD